MICKAPEAIDHPHTFCPGCGQGICSRIIGEVIEELDIKDRVVITCDVACGEINAWVWEYDTIVAAHGRPIPVAIGVKRARKDTVSVAHLGDGAAYNIGMAETIHAALRDDNVLVLIFNNGVFGMTGGQMSACSLIGQKTASSVHGKKRSNGSPFRIEDAIGSFDIAYLARCSVESVPSIRNTKKCIKKAFEKHMNNEGFCCVEVLTPCPTNWNLSPVDAMKRLKEQVIPEFPVGEFVDRGGNANGND